MVIFIWICGIDSCHLGILSHLLAWWGWGWPRIVHSGSFSVSGVGSRLTLKNSWLVVKTMKYLPAQTTSRRCLGGMWAQCSWILQMGVGMKEGCGCGGERVQAINRTRNHSRFWPGPHEQSRVRVGLLGFQPIDSKQSLTLGSARTMDFPPFTSKNGTLWTVTGAALVSVRPCHIIVVYSDLSSLTW